MVDSGARESGGNKSFAARMLGISRDTLRYRLSKMKEELGSKILRPGERLI